jgi:hypothetical protein
LLRLGAAADAGAATETRSVWYLRSRETIFSQTGGFGLTGAFTAPNRAVRAESRPNRKKSDLVLDKYRENMLQGYICL